MARGYRRHRNNYAEYDDDESTYNQQNYSSDEEMEHDILDARAQYSRSKILGLACVIGLPLMILLLTGIFEYTILAFFAALLFSCAMIIGSYWRMRNSEKQYSGVLSIRDEFKSRR
jgi:hypothetical protein